MRRAPVLDGMVLSPSRTRHVPVGGASFEVTRHGSGPPLVLIPGLAGGTRLVAPLVARLGRDFEVHVSGLRGDPDGPSRFRAGSLADHAQDVAGLIRGLGLEQPLVLGVSYGAAVALQLAIDCPVSVGSLVLSGVEARFTHRHFARLARRVLEGYPLPIDSPFINQFFRLLHGDRVAAIDPLARFVVDACWETDQVVLADRLRSLENFDLSDSLWRIQAPALVVAGSRDSIVAPENQRALAQSLAAEYAEIPGGGHVSFLSHVEAFAGFVASRARERVAAFG